MTTGGTDAARSASGSTGLAPVVQRFDRVGAARISWLQTEAEAGGDRGSRPDADPPIVALHGIPASAELWRGVLGRLGSAGRRAYAPDLPGYGASRPAPGGDWSLGASADLLAAWIEARGIGPVHLVGHDLGGAVAQLLATRRPGLVAALTLGDTVVGGDWPVPPVRLLRATARAGLYPTLCAVGLLPNPGVAWSLRRGFADPSRLGAADRRRVFWDGKVTDPEGRRAFAEHLRALDPTETAAVVGDLGALPMPCALVWGAEDRYQPWDRAGATLRELLPAPAVTVVGDAGHFAPLERPAAVATALLAGTA